MKAKAALPPLEKRSTENDHVLVTREGGINVRKENRYSKKSREINSKRMWISQTYCWKIDENLRSSAPWIALREKHREIWEKGEYKHVINRRSTKAFPEQEWASIMFSMWKLRFLRLRDPCYSKVELYTSTVNSTWTGEWVHGQKLRKVIQLLQDEGFIEHEKGFFYASTGSAKPSVVRPTERSILWLDQVIKLGLTSRGYSFKDWRKALKAAKEKNDVSRVALQAAPPFIQDWEHFRKTMRQSAARLKGGKVSPYDKFKPIVTKEALEGEGKIIMGDGGEYRMGEVLRPSCKAINLSEERITQSVSILSHFLSCGAVEGDEYHTPYINNTQAPSRVHNKTKQHDSKAMNNKEDNLPQVRPEQALLFEGFDSDKLGVNPFAMFDEAGNIKPDASKMTRNFQAGLTKEGTVDPAAFGGRYYMPLQNLPKDARKALLIDGERTIKLDICDAHLRIIFGLEGISLPDDVKSLLHPQSRAAGKIVALYLIGTASKPTLSALNAVLRKEGHRGLKKNEWLKLLEFVKPIQHHLGSGLYRDANGNNIGAWGIAQRVESDIATDIMIELGEADITIIPIHDGFMVKESKMDELAAALQRAWQKHLPMVYLIWKQEF